MKNKILFLDFKFEYLNPIISTFKKLFVIKNFKVDYFTPFENEPMSKDKTFNYLKSIEHRYSFFVLTHQFFLSNKKLSFKNSIIKSNWNEYLDMHSGIIKFLQNSKKNILFFSNFDYQELPDTKILTLSKKKNLYLITPGIEFFSPNIKKLKIGEKSLRKTDFRWIDFLRKNPKKIISFPNWIDNSEFKKINFKNKKYDFSILGINYVARVKFYNFIKKKTFKYITQFFIYKFLLFLNRYIKSKNIIYFLRETFSKKISQSIFSFSCGSKLKILVRKFLEIPAFGSCLIADPFYGYENFGFIHKKNFIDVNKIYETNNIESIYHKKLYKKITIEGQSLIKKKHSVHARRKQLTDVLKLINQGKFQGSYWSKGKFLFK